MPFQFSTPGPSPSPSIDPSIVTPGTLGWIVVLVLAIAVVLLAIDMLRRVRRVKYREEVNEALDAEQAAERDEGINPR